MDNLANTVDHLLIAGTNWAAAIIHLLNNAADLERGEDVKQPINASLVMFEIQPPPTANTHLTRQQAEAMQGPRLMISHLPMMYFKQQIEKCPGLRVRQ